MTVTAALWAVVTGCGDEKPDTGATPSCTTCTTTPTLPAPSGDGTTSATAVLWPGGSTAWTYTSPRAQWVRLDVSADEGAVIDLILEQGNGEPWASSGGFPGGGLASGDVALVAWLPRADIWRITLVESGDPIDTAATTALPYTTTLSVRLFGGGVVDGEAGEVAPSVALDDGATGATVGSVLEATGDVDSVPVTFAVGGQPLEVYGWSETPGSDLRPRLKLLHDSAIVATLDGVGETGVLSVFDPAPGDWTLQVTDALAGGGIEMWGAFVVRTWEAGDDHPVFGALPWATETEPNEDAATADTPPEMLDGYAVWQVQGTLDSEDDVDATSIVADPDEVVSARCWGADSGSAVDLTVDVEVAGVEVTPLGQGTLPTSLDYYVYNAAVTPGTVTFLVRNDGTTAGPSAYYRCRFIASVDLLGVGNLP